MTQSLGFRFQCRKCAPKSLGNLCLGGKTRRKNYREEKIWGKDGAKPFFGPRKMKKQASQVAYNWANPFFSQSSPDHSPELIFHIVKSRDQTSVLLSVLDTSGRIFLFVFGRIEDTIILLLIFTALLIDLIGL